MNPAAAARKTAALNAMSVLSPGAAIFGVPEMIQLPVSEAQRAQGRVARVMRRIEPRTKESPI